ncbi:PRC-barrel domain-containing protein [Microvirga sp. BT688]|uniref:PRC-barrel domain-containing protein n=1 Tax=Microvirga sp. TaxID=1873136 RepID=UPI001682B2A8|nr:PRC-barrel domain-containing protein [Microvirga sp.]MBD2749914.1 PRC-barrel domain-containing protein [Microvirga sp.]
MLKSSWARICANMGARTIPFLGAASLSLVTISFAGAQAPTATPAPSPPAAQAPSSPPQANPQPAQPGIRTVDPTTVRLTFYTVQPVDMLVSNLLDADVYNLQNEEIGEVEDVIVDEGRVIRAVIISVGGFLGLGERNVAADPGSLVLMREAGGEIRVVANTTREDLQNAPEFKFEGNMSR